jgi:hypothetical protein
MADGKKTSAQVISLERKRHARAVLAAFLALNEQDRKAKLQALQETRQKAKTAL